MRAAQNEYQRRGRAGGGGGGGARGGEGARPRTSSRRSLKYDALEARPGGEQARSPTASSRGRSRRTSPATSRPRTSTSSTPRSCRALPSGRARCGTWDSRCCFGLGCAVAAAFFRDYLDTLRRPAGRRAPARAPPARRDPRVAGAPGRSCSARPGRGAVRRGLPGAAHGARIPATVEGRARSLLVTSTLPGRGQEPDRAEPRAHAWPRPMNASCSIDADLRRPSLHTLAARASRSPGLTEVLTRRADPLEGSVSASRARGSACCLRGARARATRRTCWPGTPSATCSRTLRDALRPDRAWTRRPRARSPTPSSWRPLADGVLVVARSGKVDRGARSSTFSSGSPTRARNVLGVVLNRARPDRHALRLRPALRGRRLPASASALASRSPREVRPDHSQRRPS